MLYTTDRRNHVNSREILYFASPKTVGVFSQNEYGESNCSRYAHRDDCFVGGGGGGGAWGGFREGLVGMEGIGGADEVGGRWGGPGAEVSMGGGRTAEALRPGTDCERLREWRAVEEREECLEELPLRTSSSRRSAYIVMACTPRIWSALLWLWMSSKVLDTRGEALCTIRPWPGLCRLM